MKAPFQIRPLLICFLFTLLFGIAAFAQDKDKEWRPVTSDELASQKPLVDPDADAEAIFWEVRIDDSGNDDLALKHYVRVKIFNERGRERYSKLDVQFFKGQKIKDLAARITRPNGTTVELKKEDVFEREIVNANGVKVKAKSFAVPNIEPGVIIEYRYKEVLSNSTAIGMSLPFQRDIPIQKLSYYYKTANKSEPLAQPYNLTDTSFVKDKDGFWLAAKENIPAFKEEPRMPPDDMVRPWMLLSHSRIGWVWTSNNSFSLSIKTPGVPSLYWGAVGAERVGYTRYMNKENPDIKKAAAEMTSGAATAEEKLRKIYDFCQTQIANISYDPSITDEQRAKLPAIKTLADVLKRKSATAQYVDLLFGALANASGFETRIAYIGNRSKMFIDPQMTNENLIHPGAIAVKIDNSWKYFNPGMRFLSFGKLIWYEEDTWAFLVGETRSDWKKTPFTNYAESETRRNGKFTLLEDGTLEGTVQMELNGQPALLYRLYNYDEASSKLEENLTQDIKRRISTAEISDASIENLLDSSKPVIQKYKIRIPGYAQKTGKRIFLQPGFFEYGEAPVFSSSTRKYDIFFQYPWAEADHVEIAFPRNFGPDNADAPGIAADPRNIGLLDVKIAVLHNENTLNYDRKFHFGGGGYVLFGAEMYQPLKALFDTFHKADSHTITLKQR